MDCYWNSGGRTWHEGQLCPQYGELVSTPPCLVRRNDGQIYHPGEVGLVHAIVVDWSESEWRTLQAATQAGFRIMIEVKGQREASK